MNLHGIPTRSMPPPASVSSMPRLNDWFTNGYEYHPATNFHVSLPIAPYPSVSRRVQDEIRLLRDQMRGLGVPERYVARLAVIVSPDEYRLICADPFLSMSPENALRGGVTIYGMRVVPLL